MAGKDRAHFRTDVYGPLAALVIGVLLVFASAAGAAVPFKDISSSGPLTNVYVGNELSCQVRHAGDSQLELFPPTAIPGDCGTFLAVGGGLFAPNFGAHDGTATGSLGSYTPFTPVSQSEVGGSGTDADPFRVTTVVNAGATGLRITEVNSYVVGRESYRTDTTVTNTGGAAQDAILYHAGDCYLQESDIGYGFVQVEGDRSSPGCSANAHNDPPGRIEQFVSISGGNNFYEAAFSEVWSAIGAQAPFPNTCRCEEVIDNGAGLSWNISIPAGGEVTRSRSTTFSPTGQVESLTPEFRQSLVAGLVSGTVLIRERGESEFHELTGKESIPLGSSVETKNGRVGITAATKSGGTQRTEFYKGQFKVDQAGNGQVRANLKGAKLGSCKGGSKSARGGSKKLARLWGKGKGKARTKGRRGSGTVRGTTWLTEERCNGTFFKVKKGKLQVRDFKRKKNVTLRRGESYLAKG